MERQKLSGLTRREFLGGAAVVGAGLLAGCGPAPTTVSQPPTAVQSTVASPTALPTATPAPKTFVFGASEEPGDLDAFNSTGSAGDMAALIVRQIAPPLLRWAPDLTFKGALAESWEASPDGLTWTFRLRDNLVFQSGKKVTAQEVVRNYDRMFDPAAAIPGRTAFDIVDGYKAVDDLTMQFVLKQASAPFIAALAYVNGIVDMDEYDPNHPVGAGPFKFVEWERGSHVRMAKHDGYWEPGLPKTDVLDWRFFPDEDVLQMALRAGEVDAVQMVPFKAAASIQEDPNMVLYSAPGMTDYYVILNVSEPPFDNLKVRQAVAHAINKQDVIDAALFGWGVPTHGSYPEGTVWYTDVQEYPYDPEKAKQLLAEGGYPDGFQAEMPIPNWTPAPQFSQAIQAQLKEIGIELELTQYEWAAYLSEIWKCGASKITMMADTGYPDPDLRYTWLFHTGSSDNVMCYSNAKVDELLDKGRVAINEADRVAIYAELQKQLALDLPVVWVYLRKQLRAWRTYVKDFPEHGCSDYWLNFDKVYAEK